MNHTKRTDLAVGNSSLNGSRKKPRSDCKSQLFHRMIFMRYEYIFIFFVTEASHIKHGNSVLERSAGKAFRNQTRTYSTTENSHAVCMSLYNINARQERMISCARSLDQLAIWHST